VANFFAQRKQRECEVVVMHHCNTIRGVIMAHHEREQRRYDPKDGELCLRRAKPEETLVEARRDSDVQIDLRSWV
jgi:hypothetical protein